MARLAVIPLLALGAVLAAAASGLPRIGDPESPAATHASPRYIARGHEETGATNLVTGVLADYRAYDTLGETTVICAAGLACWLILGGRSRGAGS
ncbi:MAG: hypothetical protein QGG24_00585 [Vicinamibacterales bacterium]|jgi:multicomponent Na+:H+ antiporter subunit B|nr:hypothetical protein [Acidobacteriota bacterium]MDP7293791.1 hypothetical protein [Vicinamibacterales bacterium]MDP7470874.1 hypothetical protein [Vicinamibacterales bacterium]MDP7670958.1 hypothetical protein [Vicinamibacterales bacterium]HJO39702.1 hydrogen gas-evolving membrane-bound hydrogenase subunit E [Vicinamibacterales bacterium]|tara:strand:+ start:859 stop:1143 length:285 start_codon:yes stop_codon:yes gene_type:complete